MPNMIFDPLNDGISSLTVIDHMGSDQSIVNAARISLAGDLSEHDTERDVKLIRYLLGNGHWSCFEHCCMTFRVVAPLPISDQWQRHKSWSFNKLSRRYTDENIQVFSPALWRGQGDTNRQASKGEIRFQGLASLLYNGTARLAGWTYRALIRLGVSREQARFVLPQGTYTAFYATANLRSIIHFIQGRHKPDAQPEIFWYADALLDALWLHFPLTAGILIDKGMV